MSELIAWLLEPVTMPRVVEYTMLLTSPALWSTWAKQRFAERFGDKKS